MKTHKDLEVWKKSIEMVTKIYTLTRNFPKEELYGLSSQVRRAAVSVASNIAEGAGRKSDKELLQFLYYSMGSLSEIETQLIISYNLGYLNNEQKQDIDALLSSIFKMLSGLITSLKKNNLPYNPITRN